jgi:hypothetical protein
MQWYVWVKHGGTGWTSVSLKTTVLWDVEPCSPLEVYRGACCLHHQGDRPDDGGRKHLWNISKLLPDYTAQHSTRQLSLYSPPWESKISPSVSSISRELKSFVNLSFIFDIEETPDNLQLEQSEVSSYREIKGKYNSRKRANILDSKVIQNTTILRTWEESFINICVHIHV